MNGNPAIQDAEYRVAGEVRPCLGVIEVPVEKIDGEETVGVALVVRGKGDGLVVLEIGGKSVMVRADHLAQSLASLAMLAGPPTGAIFGAPPWAR